MNLKKRLINLRNAVLCFFDVVLWAVMKRRVPTFVVLSLADRCTFRCWYCRLWERNYDDMPTERIMPLLDEMKKAGVKHLALTGGEPLLREDLEEIINRAYVLGFTVVVVTNGLVTTENIHKLKQSSELVVTFNASQEVTDEHYGDGTYRRVIEGIEAARDLDLKVEARGLLYDDFMDDAEHVIDKTRELGVNCAFEAADIHPMIRTGKQSLVPPREKYEAFVDRLIELKKTNPHMKYSLATLKYMRALQTPGRRKTPDCIAGRLHAFVDTDGNIYSCHSVRGSGPVDNVFETGFKEAFERLPLRSPCTTCPSLGLVELAYIARMHPGVIWNQIVEFFR